MSDTYTLSNCFSTGRSFIVVRVQLVTRCPPPTLHQKSAGPAPLALPEDDTCWVTLDMQVQCQFHTDVQGDGSGLVELNCRAPLVCFSSCVCLLQLVNWVFLNFQLRVKTSTPVYSIKVCFALVSLRVSLCLAFCLARSRTHTHFLVSLLPSPVSTSVTHMHSPCAHLGLVLTYFVCSDNWWSAMVRCMT